MRADYTLITGDISEKELVKRISKNIDRIVGVEPRIKNRKLVKKPHTGMCNPFEPEKEFHYEEHYIFRNRYIYIFVELYPNVNDNQEVKFDVEGAMWNLYIDDYRDTDVTDNSEPLIEELLKDIPVKYSLIKEYIGNENRL